MNQIVAVMLAGMIFLLHASLMIYDRSNKGEVRFALPLVGAFLMALGAVAYWGGVPCGQ